MLRKLLFLTSFLLVLTLVGTGTVFGETVETRISDDRNDNEEDLNPSKLGETDLDSSDLEFPYEDGGQEDPQLIGLRFQVDVPAGNVVTNAWIRFQVDSVSKTPDTTDPVNVIIEGQLDPNAAGFVDEGAETFDISSRPVTAAKAYWSVPAWEAVGDQGPAQTSVNIASIIQEIIDIPGWKSGNSLVLIIRDDPNNPSIGMREAEGGPGDDAALLHVEFAIPVAIEIGLAAESDDAEEDVGGSADGAIDLGSSDLEFMYDDDPNDPLDEQVVGLRFTGVEVPKGTIIAGASVRFMADDVDDAEHVGDAYVIIKGQLSPDPVTFADAPNDIAARPTTEAQVSWGPVHWSEKGALYSTVDISSIIQEIVNQDDWASGNALVLIFGQDPANPSTGVLEAENHKSGSDENPTLRISALIDIATIPAPANGAEGVLLGSTMSWKPVPAGVTREVYFGDSNEPPLVSIQEGTSYYPGPMDVNTTYYWRVDEVEADGTTVHAGGLWSFTSGLSNVSADTAIASQNDDGEDHIAYVDAEGVEQEDDGAEGITSSDLEMPWEGDALASSLQVIGLRFTDMPLVQGEAITEAYVQLTADNENLDGGPVNLIISGLLLPDTDQIGSGEDFSARSPKTVADVNWTDIPEWTSGQATDASRSPDISSIIQEIVDQDGWAKGNAIMLFIRDDETNPSVDNRSALSGNAVLHVPTDSDAATQPGPANGAENVPVDAMLSWWPGLDAVSHEVFMWTDTPPETIPLLANTTEVTLDPGELQRGTTYYWQTKAIIDAHNATFSNIWSFSTPAVKATQPVPADGAVELLDPVTLQWAAPAGAVDYTVYVSADAVIDEADLLGTVIEAELALSELTPGVTYSWRVDATHEDLTTYEGDVWQFTMFPAEALNPNPADGGLWGIGIDTELSWTSGLGAMLHHVYFSADKALVDARDPGVASMYWMTNTFGPGELVPGTAYYWAVDEFDGVGTAAGATWSFETSGP
ncbi:MAG: hypothetical protein GY809_21600 [Planctomycetes bacterium]|nr:hypothetical protein [Planctomycetota bacterium]